MQGLPKNPSEATDDWQETTAEAVVKLMKSVLVLGNRNALNIKDFRD